MGLDGVEVDLGGAEVVSRVVWVDSLGLASIEARYSYVS